MATLRKRGSRWQAIVRKGEINATKSFGTKIEAMLWAEQVEAGKIVTSHRTFGDVLRRYQYEVTPRKRGARWESIRIDLLLRDALAEVPLSDLGKRHFAEWRDGRLKTISGRSVIREMAILSHAIKTAINEWEWMMVNPLSAIEKPQAAGARTRLPTKQEIDRLLHVFGTDYGTIMGRVGLAMLFAIETGMRAKEICGLRKFDVTGNVAKIRDAKTKAGIRDVPLSKEAARILGLLGDDLFAMSTASLDALFRKGKKKAMVDELHFHDFRAEAATRLSKKLDVLELARMLGHSDLSKLLIYYRLPAADIAKRL